MKLTRPTWAGSSWSAKAGTAAITRKAARAAARERIAGLDTGLAGAAEDCRAGWRSAALSTRKLARRVPLQHGPALDDGFGQSKLRGSAPVDKAAADQLPVDLVGTLPDLRDLGVPQQPLDPEFLDVAVPAMQLHRLGGDPHRQIGGAHFQHRRLDTDIALAGIDEARDMPQPRVAHRQIGGEVGEQKLDALKLDDAAAGLPALVEIGRAH